MRRRFSISICSSAVAARFASFACRWKILVFGTKTISRSSHVLSTKVRLGQLGDWPGCFRTCPTISAKRTKRRVETATAEIEKVCNFLYTFHRFINTGFIPVIKLVLEKHAADPYRYFVRHSLSVSLGAHSLTRFILCLLAAAAAAIFRRPRAIPI